MGPRKGKRRHGTDHRGGNEGAVHEAQLLSYLKLSGYRVGLLINFHVLHLKDGIRRLVNSA